MTYSEILGRFKGVRKSALVTEHGEIPINEAVCPVCKGKTLSLYEIAGQMQIESACRCSLSSITQAAGLELEDLILDAEWEPPIPFDAISTPGFPIESLPGPIFAYVEALAEFTQTPVEMAAILSLGVLATALQSKFEIEAKPGYREPMCLYTVAVALPGERKSAVHSAITAPVYAYEDKRQREEAEEVEANKAEKEILQKSLDDAKNAVVKGKGKAKQDEARCEMQILIEKQVHFEEKHYYKLLVSDTTPEKLVEIMESQGGCISISSAEGGLFDMLAGQYDRRVNIDPYLSGHAGEPIKVDRIGRKSNKIDHPRLTMMLTVQPEVINGLMGNATFKGRGLCGRFLYAICGSRVGRRKVDTEPIPASVEEDYTRLVTRLLEDQSAGVICLSEEARKIEIGYAETVEHRLGYEWEHMADWGGKLRGAALRIAGLIHAAEVRGNPTETPVSPEVMEAAIKIAECLGFHAMAAYQMMGANEAQADAKYLWKRIESTGQGKIAKQDLWQLCKGKIRAVADMAPAMKLLSEMGYIREKEIKTGKRGRPSISVIVNPCELNTKNTKNREIR